MDRGVKVVVVLVGLGGSRTYDKERCSEQQNGWPHNFGLIQDGAGRRSLLGGSYWLMSLRQYELQDLAWSRQMDKRSIHSSTGCTGGVLEVECDSALPNKQRTTHACNAMVEEEHVSDPKSAGARREMAEGPRIWARKLKAIVPTCLQMRAGGAGPSQKGNQEL